MDAYGTDDLHLEKETHTHTDRVEKCINSRQGRQGIQSALSLVWFVYNKCENHEAGQTKGDWEWEGSP